MKALIQRVLEAQVRVDAETVGAIGAGLLVFLAVERHDQESQAERMLERLLGYRVFADENGRMNHSVTDTQGGLLVVSQFTLAADTRKGTRPSFTPAAEPDRGRALYEYFMQQAQERHAVVASGRYGADMQVALVNDGPVTFLLEVPA